MNRLLAIAGVSLCILLTLLFTTDPNNIPSIILVAPFILLFVFLISLILFFLEKKEIAGRKALKIAGICTGIPLLLLVLQSIGQLTARDVLVLGALFVVSYFYILRSPTTS